jgi:hypothetical protein
MGDASPAITINSARDRFKHLVAKRKKKQKEFSQSEKKKKKKPRVSCLRLRPS